MYIHIYLNSYLPKKLSKRTEITHNLINL